MEARDASKSTLLHRTVPTESYPAQMSVVPRLVNLTLSLRGIQAIFLWGRKLRPLSPLSQATCVLAREAVPPGRVCWMEFP